MTIVQSEHTGKGCQRSRVAPPSPASWGPAAQEPQGLSGQASSLIQQIRLGLTIVISDRFPGNADILDHTPELLPSCT
jgi:hypothetical protein